MCDFQHNLKECFWRWGSVWIFLPRPGNASWNVDQLDVCFFLLLNDSKKISRAGSLLFTGKMLSDDSPFPESFSSSRWDLKMLNIFIYLLSVSDSSDGKSFLVSFHSTFWRQRSAAAPHTVTPRSEKVAALIASWACVGSDRRDIPQILSIHLPYLSVRGAVARRR